jgi:high-affinity K+ transport system ATPase subunit B
VTTPQNGNPGLWSPMDRREPASTGDWKAVADSVARRTGIDEVAAKILPVDKAASVKKFPAGGKRVAIVGDGVNDAPALATNINVIPQRTGPRTCCPFGLARACHGWIRAHLP